MSVKNLERCSSPAAVSPDDEPSVEEVNPPGTDLRDVVAEFNKRTPGPKLAQDVFTTQTDKIGWMTPQTDAASPLGVGSGAADGFAEVAGGTLRVGLQAPLGDGKDGGIIRISRGCVGCGLHVRNATHHIRCFLEATDQKTKIAMSAAFENPQT